MASKRAAKNISIILGLSVVLMFISFIFVAHHLDTPNRIRQNRDALLGGSSGAADRTKPIGQIDIAPAETAHAPVPEPTQTAVAATEKTSVDGQQVYQSFCAACHAAGIAGAPKTGDANIWSKRIAKGVGVSTLYASAINGMQGTAGVMPAKGGNPTLSDAQVKAAVDYILGQSK